MKKNVFLLLCNIFAAANLLMLSACGGWKSYDGKSESDVMKDAYEHGQEWAKVSGVDNLDEMDEAFKRQCFGDALSAEDTKVYMRCRDELVRGAADAVLGAWKIEAKSLGGYNLKMTPQEMVGAGVKNNPSYNFPLDDDLSELPQIKLPDIEIGKNSIKFSSAFSDNVVNDGKWNDVKPLIIQGKVDIHYKAGNKNMAKLLTDRIVSHVKSLGSIAKECVVKGDNQTLLTIVSTGNDNYLLCGVGQDDGMGAEWFEVFIALSNSETLRKMMAEVGQSWP